MTRKRVETTKASPNSFDLSFFKNTIVQLKDAGIEGTGWEVSPPIKPATEKVPLDAHQSCTVKSLSRNPNCFVLNRCDDQ